MTCLYCGRDTGHTRTCGVSDQIRFDRAAKRAVREGKMAMVEIAEHDNAMYEKLVNLLIEESERDAKRYPLGIDGEEALKRIIQERDRLREALQAISDSYNMRHRSAPEHMLMVLRLADDALEAK